LAAGVIRSKLSALYFQIKGGRVEFMAALIERLRGLPGEKKTTAASQFHFGTAHSQAALFDNFMKN
jgi:hypothetical protein